MSYFLNSICLCLYSLNEKKVAAGKADEQYTLLDINPMLQYKDQAVKILSELDLSESWHQEILAWWMNTYFALNDRFKNEVIMPILSKIGVFSDNVQLRRIVGQPITQAPIHQAVTEGNIVLCALSSKDMDDASVNILGSTLINLLHRSFSLQQQTPLTERRKVFCAIDELQNFSGSAFDALLSEDAKLGCAMFLATQNLKRLNKIRDGLLEMMLSNCQHLFVFRISAADAQVMETELQEKVTVKHIISQPNLHCYARLALPGHPIQICSATLIPPGSVPTHQGRDQVIATIRDANQQRYMPVAEVDRRYSEHVKQFLDAEQLWKQLKSFKKNTRDASHAKQKREQDQQRADTLQTTRLEYSTVPASDTAGTSNQQDAEETSATADGTADAGSSKLRKQKRHRGSRGGKKSANKPSPNLQEEDDLDGDEDEDSADEDVDDGGTPLRLFTQSSGGGSGREYGERERE